MRDVFSDIHLLVLTLVLNWIIGTFSFVYMSILWGLLLEQPRKKIKLNPTPASIITSTQAPS
jgi:ACR3 family arsenite efflux pump ArsB